MSDVNFVKHRVFKETPDDEFGDVEFIGYVGGSYDKFYGELSAVTNEDLVDWGAKAGVKFTF